MENTNLFTIRVQGLVTGDGVSGDEVRHNELSGGSRVYHWCDDTDGGG